VKQSIPSWPAQNLFDSINMKRILFSFTLVGIIAGSLAGLAQTNPSAGDAAAASATATTNDLAQPAAPPAPVPAAGAAAPANAQAAVQPSAPASNPPAVEAAAAVSDTARTPGLAQRGGPIPLIVMDDVPLTDAIRNLARQAEINYLLDPKIGFGQVGPDGKATPQPNVSIRWENITAEQALNALLNNYSLQVIEDPKSKIARVTVKDPAAPPPLSTKIIQLKYANPSNIVVNVQGTLTDKRSKVMPDNRTSQLVVVATEAEMADVEQLIERLDTRTKQVLIEARLIETTINPSTKKGIDWSGTLDSQHATFGNGLTTGSSSSANNSQSSSQSSIQSLSTTPGTPVTTTTTLPGGRSETTTFTPPSDGKSVASSTTSSGAGAAANSVLNSLFGNNAGLSLNTANGLTPNVGFLSADGVRATLSFLNNYSESKVLSSPRTVTLDNEEARIEVGTLFPIVNTAAGTANTSGGSQVTYSNLTVSLKVTPRISANDYVNLRVTPNITRLGPLVVSKVGGVDNAVYEFLTRSIETRVLIPSGTTLVMGGLISDEVGSSNIKVPILGDIPVLGLLFRMDSKNRTKQNLLVFVTPTIVQDEDFQPTKSNFLKNPVPLKDSIEDDWSAWDSGKPKDWSKKKAPQAAIPDGSVGQSETSANR
jgi:type II secretory pathway component GspD/PulD (secretin)